MESVLNNEKAIVVFSGGQDSTTCLFYAKKHFKEVELVRLIMAKDMILKLKSQNKLHKIKE
ncbi:Queuosine Biosynthesis QueC ATPase [Staphylococcus aureus]|nr:Queuosine Biosynthesis QueC ATPase [Staphylococcus aureus]